jgi:hypothetical protein
MGRIGDGTNGQDDFNQSALHSKQGLATSILRLIQPYVSNFDKKAVVPPPEWGTGHSET